MESNPRGFVPIIVAVVILIGIGLILGVAKPKEVKLPLTTTKSPSPTSTPDSALNQISKGKCVVGGCNSELCVDDTEKDIVSICIYNDKYACYKNARCERQKDGKCGWSQTEELKACLEKY